MDDGTLDGLDTREAHRAEMAGRAEVSKVRYIAHAVQSPDPPQPPLLHGQTPLRIEQRGSLRLASLNVDGAEEKR